MKAEIERLGRAFNGTVSRQIAASANGTDGSATDGIHKPGPPPAAADVLPPEIEVQAKTVADLGLNRVWILERLMRNVRIAMGEEKVTVTKLFKVAGGKPDEYIAVQTEVFARDSAAANAGLALLSKELDRLEAKGYGGRRRREQAGDRAQ